MKSGYRRAVPALAATMFVIDLCASGCTKSAGDQSSTLGLLRAGSEQICTTSDVQQVLKGMIVPKPSEIGGDASDADKHSAIDQVTLAYSTTTLQGFDAAVSRASCNATVKVSAGDQSDSFDMSYSISPSAEDSGSIVVRADDGDAKTYALGLINDTITRTQTTRSDQELAAQAQQAHSELLAVIRPRWLVGKWIAPGADPATCANEIGLTFEPDRVFHIQGRSGRWTIDADQIHFIGGGPSGSVDAKSTITQADAVSFTTTNSDGETTNWRRCARSEMVPPASPDGPVGSALSSDNSH